jgi:hypothetical protein
MNSPSISFTSLGLVVLDEIRFPNQEPLLDILGGSGAYGWSYPGVQPIAIYNMSMG